ncbi:MAG: hypothetical protein J6Q51_01870, partial [Clostridia bacterium]|nr:hypothetical protein [Clostridia bacterium]
MENEFYDRIVYKKSAYLQLKEDLEKYYYGKKILLITTIICTTSPVFAFVETYQTTPDTVNSYM